MEELPQPNHASPYTTVPLPQDGHQYIRLLTILPGNDADIISCRLHVCRLDSAPPYEALSYCWGDTQNPVSIACNGLPMSVRPNLGAALRRLRNRRKSSGSALRDFFSSFRKPSSHEDFLWIDAICIDQSDLIERSNQVKFMIQIYEQAGKVIIWFGEGDDTTSIGMQTLEKVMQHCRNETKSTGFEAIRWLQQNSHPARSTPRRGLPPHDSKAWDSVYKILNNAYFSRIWTVQEASAGKAELWVQNGRPVPWTEFMPTAYWLFRNINGTSLALNASIAHSGIYYARQIKSDHLNLLDMLHTTWSFQATDPRDKLYALYGLTRERSALNSNTLTMPNYEKSVMEVFRDLTRFLIMQPDEDNDSILQYIAFFKLDHTGSDGFPSWVPRCDKNRPFESDPGALITSVAGSRHRAGGDTTTEVLESEPFSLILRGICVAMVSTILSFSTTSSPREKLVSLYASLVQESGDREGDDKDSFKGKFARTISLGGAKLYPRRTGKQWEAVDLDACLAKDGDEALSHFMAAYLDDRGRMFLLDNQTFGLSLAADIQEGDIVCIFFGQKTPFVIRPCGDHFTFVSNCYVDELMFGKAVDEWKAGRLNDQWIELR